MSTTTTLESIRNQRTQCTKTLSIASKATGVSKVAISNDMNKATKEWNRIGNAFRDRKYKYYKCPENFEDARSENRKKAWEKVIARKNA